MEELVAKRVLGYDHDKLAKVLMPNARWRDLIVDYLRRDIASVANVASHFGMSQDYAMSALLTLEVEGRARRVSKNRWEIADGE